MTVRRLIIAVGAVLLVAGVIGLLTSLSVPDGNGGTVACGNAIAPDTSAAKAANDKSGANIPVLNQLVPHTDFVAQCKSAVHGRQMWAIPMMLFGMVGIAGPLLARRTKAESIGV